MRSGKMIISIIVLALVEGGLCAIIHAPLNVIDEVGAEVILQCESDATTARDQISWYFEQYGTNYTSTVVSGCTPTEDFNVQTTTEGQCNLNISSLDGRHAGRYTCQNGIEAPVAALVGCIVNGPSHQIIFKDPLVEGDKVTYLVFWSISGAFNNRYQWTSSQFCPSTRALPSDQSQTSDWNEAPTRLLKINHTISACRPEVYPLIYTQTFTVSVQEPILGNATNNPTYEYIWTSPRLEVRYKPHESDIVISGCFRPLEVGDVLTCYAPANPLANYTWINPNGTETSGESITVDQIGNGVNYTCVAWNSIGSSSKTCEIPVYITDSGAQWNFNAWLIITGFIFSQLYRISYGYVSALLSL